MKVALDKRWHLAEDAHEIDLTELEFSIMRVSAAFDRWRSDCMACCIDASSPARTRRCSTWSACTTAPRASPRSDACASR